MVLPHHNIVQLLAQCLAPARGNLRTTDAAFPGISFDGPTAEALDALHAMQSTCGAPHTFKSYKVWPPRVGILDREGSRKLVDGGESFLKLVRAGGVPAARFLMSGSLTPWEQVRRMATLDAVVTPHGAGNALCIYMSPHALCAQVLPKDPDYARMTLFQMLSSLAGVQYREWQSTSGGHWLSAALSLPATSKAEY